MSQIFISYRRSDSRHVAGRIYDRLEKEFGPQRIFKDIDSIGPGDNFPGVLHEATANCSVMLVIIGSTWINVQDNEGRRRLDDVEDFVRQEVEAGLNRDGVLVIPTLVSNAAPPHINDLPDSLRGLAYKNAVAIDDGRNFHRDVDQLIKYIRPRIKGTNRTRNIALAVLAMLTIIVLVAIGFFVNNLISDLNLTATAEQVAVEQSVNETETAGAAFEGTETSIALTNEQYALETQTSIALTNERDRRATQTADARTQTALLTPEVEAPIANFTHLVDDESPLLVQFTNQSTGDISQYNWDFGDGNSSTQVNPTHVYSGGGTYVVKLEAIGPGGQATKFFTIVVTEPETLGRSLTSCLGGGVTPDLLEWWEVSEDGISWTLGLRDGVLLPDGMPFTSATVVTQLEDTLPESTVEVIDDLTILVTLSSLNYDFAQELCDVSF